MNQKDIVSLLETLSFTGLILVKQEAKNFTYKFHSLDMRKLEKALGKPDVAANNKVAVFVIPDVGKLGVSPANSMARFVLTAELSTKRVVDDSHLAKSPTTPELSLAFYRAQGNARYKLPFLKSMWTHFNKEKFGGRLSQPRLEVSRVPAAIKLPNKTTRGVYQGGPNFGVGTLWVADFLFNAREAFFSEIVLHEMCHQAVWTLDQYRHRNAVDGHGEHWAKWMRHVGLDPRRFDPTDATEYAEEFEAAKDEALLSETYGPPKPDAYFAKLTPVTSVPSLPLEGLVYAYRNRPISSGVLRASQDRKFKYNFTGRAARGNGLVSFGFKTVPKNLYYEAT